MATVANGTVSDALAAVAAAGEAQPDWARRPPRDRGEILRRAFELMRAREEWFAELMIVLENGKAVQRRPGARCATRRSSSAGTPRRRCASAAPCRRSPAGGNRHRGAPAADRRRLPGDPSGTSRRGDGHAEDRPCSRSRLLGAAQAGHRHPLTAFAVADVFTRQAYRTAWSTSSHVGAGAGRLRDAARSAGAQAVLHRLDRGRPDAAR